MGTYENNPTLREVGHLKDWKIIRHDKIERFKDYQACSSFAVAGNSHWAQLVQPQDDLTSKI